MKHETLEMVGDILHSKKPTSVWSTYIDLCKMANFFVYMLGNTCSYFSSCFAIIVCFSLLYLLAFD